MDTANITKVRKTVIEMLEDRGFDVPLDQQNISKENVSIMLDNNNINIHVSKSNTGTESVLQKGGAHSDEAYVYFHIAGGKFDKKRLVSTISHIQETYENNNINIIIVVKKKNITAPVLKEINSESYHNVEVFYFKTLLSNKSKNRLVPEHRLLTTSEIETIATKYKLTPEQFYKESPILFTTDPMAQYYGYREGDMCEIRRNSKINGKSIGYRSVVKNVPLK